MTRADLLAIIWAVYDDDPDIMVLDDVFACLDPNNAFVRCKERFIAKHESGDLEADQETLGQFIRIVQAIVDWKRYSPRLEPWDKNSPLP